MDVLLDTHMLLWWLADDPRLSSKARRLIADRQNTLIVSAATGWEIAIKQRLGKLVMDSSTIKLFRTKCIANIYRNLLHQHLDGSLPE